MGVMNVISKFINSLDIGAGMKISEMSAENRPRERLEQSGAGALSDAELLAVILKSGTKKENVLEMCHKLLAKYGLAKLQHSTLQELMQEHGIGKAKACQLVAVFELFRRAQRNKVENAVVRRAEDIARLYLPRMQHLQQEHFVAIYLDARNRIITDQTITVGILNASLIHPREVFHGAIGNLANAVIVLHNHPSGDCTPSGEDLSITQRLHKTGETMGIELLDHVILGSDGWWSWREHRP